MSEFRTLRSEVRGFADDIELDSEIVSSLFAALEAIVLYCRASGSTANAKKTVLLPTIPWDDPKLLFDPGGSLPRHPAATRITVMSDGSSKRTLCALAGTCWEDIGCVDSTTYLGVLLGHSIKRGDVFEKAKLKFAKRISSYMKYRKTWMLYRRIQVANTFLISIFSYLACFYIMPEKTLSEINELLCRFILPLSPRSISLMLLRAPPSVFNFRTPLRCLSMNFAATILSHVDDLSLLTDGSAHHPLSIDYNRSLAADYYVHWAGELAEDTLPVLEKKDPKYISHVAQRYKHMNESQRTVKWYLARFKKKFVNAVGANDTRKISENFSLTVRKVPEYIRHTTYDLLMNTLPTSESCRMPKVVPLKHCRLCGGAKDTVRHIFGSCPVYIEAMEAAKASVLSPLPSHLRPCLATASLGADLTFEDVRLVMCLNFAVWIVHQHYREVDRSELVRGKIVRAVLDLYTEKSLATGCKKRKARASPPPQRL